MAVVLDTGAVSRGSGNEGSNKERDIRREFVEQDLIEAEEERAEADQELDTVLAKLGFADWRGGGDNGAKR